MAVGVEASEAEVAERQVAELGESGVDRDAAVADACRPIYDALFARRLRV
jgi:hypothetical protein